MPLRPEDVTTLNPALHVPASYVTELATSMKWTAGLGVTAQQFVEAYLVEQVRGLFRDLNVQKTCEVAVSQQRETLIQQRAAALAEAHNVGEAQSAR